MKKKKKKSGKQKQQHNFKGHYCKVCGERKANEKFSGKGHATHVCKVCAAKSPEQKSEDMAINKLYGMMFRHLSESEINWIKNCRRDSRAEVSELAQNIFEQRFPRKARNEIKSQLHISNIVFHVCGEMYDGYGDECSVNVEFVADTTGKIIKKTFNENNIFVKEEIVGIGTSAIRKLFNVAVHNRDIYFWDIDLCEQISFDPNIDLLPECYYKDAFDDEFIEEFCEDEETEQPDNEPDDRVPTWSVLIKYKNGTEQNTKGYDILPAPVEELFDDFNFHFEEDEFEDDEFYDEENEEQ